MKRRWLLVAMTVLMLSVASLTACGGTSIGQILADPLKFEGKQVSIKGTVGNQFWISLVDKGAYEVGDGTGTIWVVTVQPPPQKGLEVSLKGTVSTAIKLGDRTLGTVITETKR